MLKPTKNARIRIARDNKTGKTYAYVATDEGRFPFSTSNGIHFGLRTDQDHVNACKKWCTHNGYNVVEISDIRNIRLR